MDCLVSLFALNIGEMKFGVVQQLDHQLTNMAVQEMIFQSGKRQETRTRDYVNAIGCSTQTNEWRAHFPFRGRIEEGQLFSGRDVAGCKDQHSGCIQKCIWIT